MATNMSVASAGVTQPTITKYRYDVTIEYINGEDIIELDPLNIKSLVIEYDFKNNTMPLVFITLSLNDNMLTKMADTQNKATIVFTVKRFIGNTDMIIKTDYIKDSFIYFIPEDVYENSSNKNKEETNDPGVYYTVLTLGLLSQDLVNKNKKTMSGIVNKTNVLSLVYSLLSDRNLTIEPFEFNPILNGTILPPLDSKAQTLKYLNTISCFYKTSYRYFMDFTHTYLIGSSGKKTPRKDETITDIQIILKDTYVPDAMLEGLILDIPNKLCKMFVRDDYIDKLDNNILDRSYDTIVAQGVSSAPTSTTIKSTENSNIVSKRSTIRVPNDNVNLVNNIKSDMSNSMVTLHITKADVDMSLFTINKRYFIDATEVYGKEYSGEYILIKKRELYLREDDSLVGEVALTFNKIADSKIAVK